MKKIFSAQVVAWGVLALAVSQLPAQAAEENDARVIERETAAEKQAVETARKAREKKVFEQTGKITFEQILSRPDDIELNFQFAQQQVKSEDLLGAAGTLERILITNPNLHEVRLFYAVVLFRLDNLIDAQNELKKLENAPLPENLKSQVGLYQNEIKKRKRKTQFSVTQSNGFEFDNNRNASPSDKRVLFAGTPVNTSGTSRRRKDTSFLNITTVDVAQDLGTQAGHQLLASFTYFLQEQTQVDSLDLSSFQYEIGPLIKTKWADVTPSFTGSHVFLSRENYLRTRGGNIDVNRALTPKWNLNGGFRFEHQDYLPIEENQTARDRTGWEETLTGGTSYALPFNMRVGTNLIFGHKNAHRKYETYNRFGLRPYHTWLLGKGQFLINSVDVNFDRYKGIDPAVDGLHRHDSAFRYRVTYGAPLSTLLIGVGKYLPSFIKDVTATVTYEYYRSLSNISNFTYTNHKIQAMLTKKWEF